MFDELIIAEILKREKANENNQRPFLELPLPERRKVEPEEVKPESKRVIIIDTLDTECEEDSIITLDI